MHNVSATQTREAALQRLWALAVILGQGMQAGLAERGLTLARAHVIWQLQRDGRSTQRSLSRALNVTPRNVTALGDGVEAGGLVAGAAHPTDRRAPVVSLTAKGSAVAAAMREDQDGFAQLLFHDVSAEDIATFVATLDRILSRIADLMPNAST